MYISENRFFSLNDEVLEMPHQVFESTDEKSNYKGRNTTKALSILTEPSWQDEIEFSEPDPNY